MGRESLIVFLRLFESLSLHNPLSEGEKSSRKGMNIYVIILTNKSRSIITCIPDLGYLYNCYCYTLDSFFIIFFFELPAFYSPSAKVLCLQCIQLFTSLNLPAIKSLESMHFPFLYREMCIIKTQSTCILYGRLRNTIFICSVLSMRHITKKS